MMRVWIVAILISVISVVQAQDIHFSQFNFSPLNTNPANTALFEGDYRIAGNYKNQWSAQSLVPFNTISISGDMKAFSPEKLDDQLGAGLLIFRDRAGDSKFTTFELKLAVSYIKALDKNSKHFVSLGLMPGIVNRSYNLEGLNFDNQFNDGSFDPSIPIDESLAKDAITFFDLGLGTAYKFKREARKFVTGGLAISHLNKPNQSFDDAQDAKLSSKFTLHGRGNWKVADKFDIVPDFLYQFQDKKRETVYGSLVKIYLDTGKGREFALMPGIYHRTKDAVIPMVGIQYKALTSAISYDINVSDFNPATNNRGGFELSAIYIISKVKDINSEGAVCPLF